ncbi:hypothetical protein bsdcttw_17480 [Anaerocolumna chitinilytica]|uniref:Uncharacterized protein n=1 Tax=Anaerocolumna chitinilytica TaxID=1727145 RepID=A0A7I8DLU7_9FIRM|nr:hypothetical protein bsdcttw_17480 [Anaerocolumna chitinilytica]
MRWFQGAFFLFDLGVLPVNIREKGFLAQNQLYNSKYKPYEIHTGVIKNKIAHFHTYIS